MSSSQDKPAIKEKKTSDAAPKAEQLGSTANTEETSTETSPRVKSDGESSKQGIAPPSRTSIDKTQPAAPKNFAEYQKFFKEKQSLLRTSFDTLLLKIVQEKQERPSQGKKIVVTPPAASNEMVSGSPPNRETLVPVGPSLHRFKTCVPASIERTDGMTRSTTITMYRIDVSKGDASWTVYRRFDQFRQLDRKLRKKNLLEGVEVTLPGRFDRKKKLKLQDYLEFLCTQPAAEQSHYLHNFLYPFQIGDEKIKVAEGASDDAKAEITKLDKEIEKINTTSATAPSRPSLDNVCPMFEAFAVAAVVGSETRVEEGGPVKFYKIEVSSGGVTWHVYRKLSQFTKLDARLKENRIIGTDDNDLPTKQDDKNKQQRFTNYLRYLSGIPKAEEEFVKFLKPTRKSGYKASTPTPQAASRVLFDKATAGQVQFTARLTAKLYEIEVSDENDVEWIIRRKFKDFVRLDQKLKALGSIPADDRRLPTTRTKQKKRALHQYLQYILTTIQPSPQPVLDFIRPVGRLDKKKKFDPYIFIIDEKLLKQDGTSKVTKFYKVEVAKGACHWTLFRSYNDFSKLDQELKTSKALSQSDLLLPPEECHHKSPRLAAYLQHIAHIPTCAHSKALHDFMETVNCDDVFFH